MFSNDLPFAIDSLVFPNYYPPLECTNDVVTKCSKKRQRKTKEVCNVEEKIDEGNNECKNKKVLHRDIERQRRQEMAVLYGSLRSLLPLEYVKGKRSISDHMHESVGYIKHMENKISKLKNRRKKLKMLSDSVGSGGNGSPNTIITKPVYLTVNSCMDSRVEILINCGFNVEELFPLSKVIVLLQESELTVLNWISTKANDRLIHTIQSQAADLAYIDLPQLQQTLVNMINISTSFWAGDQKH